MASFLSLWYPVLDHTKWRTPFSARRITFGARVACPKSSRSVTVRTLAPSLSLWSSHWIKKWIRCICVGANWPRMRHFAMLRRAWCWQMAMNFRILRRHTLRMTLTLRVPSDSSLSWIYLNAQTNFSKTSGACWLRTIPSVSIDWAKRVDVVNFVPQLLFLLRVHSNQTLINKARAVVVIRRRQLRRMHSTVCLMLVAGCCLHKQTVRHLVDRNYGFLALIPTLIIYAPWECALVCTCARIHFLSGPALLRHRREDCITSINWCWLIVQAKAVALEGRQLGSCSFGYFPLFLLN